MREQTIPIQGTAQNVEMKNNKDHLLLDLQQKNAQPQQENVKAGSNENKKKLPAISKAKSIQKEKLPKQNKKQKERKFLSQMQEQSFDLKSSKKKQNSSKKKKPKQEIKGEQPKRRGRPKGSKTKNASSIPSILRQEYKNRQLRLQQQSSINSSDSDSGNQSKQVHVSKKKFTNKQGQQSISYSEYNILNKNIQKSKKISSQEASMNVKKGKIKNSQMKVQKSALNNFQSSDYQKHQKEEKGNQYISHKNLLNKKSEKVKSKNNDNKQVKKNKFDHSDEEYIGIQNKERKQKSKKINPQIQEIKSKTRQNLIIVSQKNDPINPGLINFVRNEQVDRSLLESIRSSIRKNQQVESIPKQGKNKQKQIQKQNPLQVQKQKIKTNKIHRKEQSNKHIQTTQNVQIKKNKKQQKNNQITQTNNSPENNIISQYKKSKSDRFHICSKVICQSLTIVNPFFNRQFHIYKKFEKQIQKHFENIQNQFNQNQIQPTKRQRRVIVEHDSDSEKQVIAEQRKKKSKNKKHKQCKSIRTWEKEEDSEEQFKKKQKRIKKY